MWRNEMIARWLVVFLLSILTTTVAEAQSWRYVDLVDGQVELVLTKEINTRSISLGHQMESALYCGNSDGFICFNSGIVSFAVPRISVVSSPLPERWTYANQEYSVKRSGHVRILGRIVKIYVVETTIADGLSFQFVYSPFRGLIAIKLKTE